MSPYPLLATILTLAGCAADAPVVTMPKQDATDSGALVLVIDRSGSMQGAKLDAAKQAATASVSALDSNDQVAIVTFDTATTVVVPLQPSANLDKISKRVSMITAGGGTNMLPALKSAYELLRTTSANTKHVIVLSDGEVPTDGIVEIVQEMRRQRMTLSTVGVAGADTQLLMMLSSEGGGRAYDVDDLATLSRTFADETKLAFR